MLILVYHQPLWYSQTAFQLTLVWSSAIRIRDEDTEFYLQYTYFRCHSGTIRKGHKHPTSGFRKWRKRYRTRKGPSMMTIQNCSMQIQIAVTFGQVALHPATFVVESNCSSSGTDSITTIDSVRYVNARIGQFNVQNLHCQLGSAAATFRFGRSESVAFLLAGRRGHRHGVFTWYTSRYSPAYTLSTTTITFTPTLASSKVSSSGLASSKDSFGGVVAGGPKG